MASPQEINAFESMLDEETRALKALSKRVKSLGRWSTQELADAVKELEAKKHRVRLMVEQSKVFGEWTTQTFKEYTPKTTYKHIALLLVFSALSYRILR